MLDVTPKALELIRQAARDAGGKAIRVIFQGFG